ncbi:MAG TPA: nuclear transport factor 2 family protein [Chitinophagaceae bacterium]
MIKKLFGTAILFLAVAIAVNGQSKDETAVAAVVEKLRKAMVDGNKAELEVITSEKLSYGHSSGLIEGKAEFVEKIVSGKSDFVTIELKDQSISISGKAAIVRHKFNATTNDNGNRGEVHLQILLIFQKEGKQWKLLARQAVRLAS